MYNIFARGAVTFATYVKRVLLLPTVGVSQACAVAVRLLLSARHSR